MAGYDILNLNENSDGFIYTYNNTTSYRRSGNYVVPDFYIYTKIWRGDIISKS